jgi:hypothetical protein
MYRRNLTPLLRMIAFNQRLDCDSPKAARQARVICVDSNMRFAKVLIND